MTVFGYLRLENVLLKPEYLRDENFELLTT